MCFFAWWSRAQAPAAAPLPLRTNPVHAPAAPCAEPAAPTPQPRPHRRRSAAAGSSSSSSSSSNSSLAPAPPPLHPVYELFEVEGERYWHCAATGESAWRLPAGADSACGWVYVGSRRGGWRHAATGKRCSSSARIMRRSRVQQRAGSGAQQQQQQQQQQHEGDAGLQQAGLAGGGGSARSNCGSGSGDGGGSSGDEAAAAAAAAAPPPALEAHRAPEGISGATFAHLDSTYYSTYIASLASTVRTPEQRAQDIVREVQAFQARRAQRKQ